MSTKYAVDNGHDRDEVERDGGGNGCTNEPEADRFRAPDYMRRLVDVRGGKKELELPRE